MTTTFKAYSLLSNFYILVLLGTIMICLAIIFSLSFCCKNKQLKKIRFIDLVLLNISSIVINCLIFYSIFSIKTNDSTFLIIFFFMLLSDIIILPSFINNFSLLMKNDQTYFNQIILIFILNINVISNKIYIPLINVLFAIISLLCVSINLKLLNDIKIKFSSKELFFYTIFNIMIIFSLSFSLFYNISSLEG